jgi:hypothetical protein
LKKWKRERKGHGIPNALSGPAGFITGAGNANLSNKGYCISEFYGMLIFTFRIVSGTIPDPQHQCGGSGMFIPDPGSDFLPSRIPDPTFYHPGSRIRTVSIPDPGSSLSILTPKKAKKWFLSSKKYDPGCSSRILDPDADFLPSRIPDPGVKKAPNPQHCTALTSTAQTKKTVCFRKSALKP